MAQNTTRTLLPLYRFGQLAGFHPLHFMQVELNTIAPAQTCDSPLLQYQWQNADRLGRDDLALVIAAAEDRIAEQLGYKLLPTWEAEVNTIFPRSNQPELYNSYSINLRNQWQSVKTQHKYVIQGGFENKTLISNSAIVYTDNDLDGYEETATITLNVGTVSTSEEIAIYYPGESGADEWEVRPIRVSLDNNTHIATITCRREQLVKPELIEAFDAEAVEGDDNTGFLSTVDVYRHFTDISRMVSFIWEKPPFICTCLSSNCPCSSDPNFIDNSFACATGCNILVQGGCLSVRNAKQGFMTLQPADFDSTKQSYNPVQLSAFRAPDRCNLYYKAGWRDLTRKYPSLQMDPKWERVVVALTLSMLERPVCNCPAFLTQYEYWSDDLARSTAQSGTSTAFQLGRHRLENPFGTKRGDIYAWEMVRRNMLQDAVVE